jgi:antitoxin YefM
MDICTYSDLRENLKARLDAVCDGRTPLLVTRKNGADCVILDKHEYDGLVETLHLLRSPANAARLLEAVAQAEAGDLVEHDLADDGLPGPVAAE